MAKRLSQADIDERYSILLSIIKCAKEIECSDRNVEFIETLIGGGIWYAHLCKWTGKVSKRALEICHPDYNGPDHCVKEHPYPRKLVASELLKYDWTAPNQDPIKTLKNVFDTYVRYNYTSDKENNQLRGHQKKGIFETPEKAYSQVGIQLVQIRNEKDLRKVLNRDRFIIDQYLTRIKSVI